MWCRSLYSFNFDLFRHYYVTLESDKLQLEVHLGDMLGGTHKTIGTTIGELIKTMKVCDECFKRKLLEARTTNYTNSYPFINCESLAREFMNEVPISWQVIYIVASALLFITFGLRVVIVWIQFLFILQHGKQTYNTTCGHI